MTTREINLLIARYLDGETTPAEEQQLALEVGRPDAPAEWAIIAEMLGELATDEALFDEIMAQRAVQASAKHVPEPITAPIPEPITAPITAPILEHISSPTHRSVKLWPWVGAAVCVALAFGLYYTILRQHAEETAQVDPSQPTEAQHEAMPLVCQPLAKAESSEDAPSHPKAKRKQTNSRRNPQITEPPVQEQPFLEYPLETPSETRIEYQETDLYLALLAEVEARALQAEQPELHLYRAIFDEIFVNIEQQSNRPELSL